MPPYDWRDHAVHHPAWSNASGTTASEYPRGRGKHFHHHWFDYGQLLLARADQLHHALVDRATSSSVVLHPGGGIRQNQSCEPSGPVSAGTSPMAHAPCMARASSRVIGWPAGCRGARSTASVLVHLACTRGHGHGDVGFARDQVP